MQSRINLLVLACLVSLAGVVFAQETITAPDTNEPNVPAFPYVAEITGDNVYIRSNAGTQYYSCGKLNKGDRVRVVSRLFTWSRIVPPADSFSWISKQYVSIDLNDSTVGIVTGDGVRVYAGSADRAPIHSTTVQLKLDRGDKVALLGEEKDDYYKIASPSGAYLWVSTQYTKPLGPVGEVTPTTEPETESVPVFVVPTTVPLEAEKLDEYYALQKRLEAERVKPIDQQNYADIKKAFLELAADKQASKAARYAEYAIKQIKRYELALEVGKAVQLQDAQLQQIRERIGKAHAKKLAEIKDLGQFAVIGKFQVSKAYGPEPGLEYYRITDDSGNIICYALPDGSASSMDLTKFIDHKVGLVGVIEPHLQTAGALVRFTEAVELP